MAVEIGGVPQPDPGWLVSLLDDNSSPVPPGTPITGVAGVDDTFAGLGDGTYFIRSQNNLTKCYSDPLQLVIQDLSNAPSVVIAQTSPDYSCVGGIPTGILTPTILGGTDADATAANFTISWTSIASGLATNTAGTSAVDLTPGDYQIVVTDVSADNTDTNCFTTMA